MGRKRSRKNHSEEKFQEDRTAWSADDQNMSGPESNQADVLDEPTREMVELQSLAADISRGLNQALFICFTLARHSSQEYGPGRRRNSLRVPENTQPPGQRHSSDPNTVPAQQDGQPSSSRTQHSAASMVQLPQVPSVRIDLNSPYQHEQPAQPPQIRTRWLLPLHFDDFPSESDALEQRPNQAEAQQTLSLSTACTRQTRKSEKQSSQSASIKK
ncbi:uncharacterized protein LOC116266087 isoform X2 [Nymphaea colorata]|uniref:uncharacterized protein LOC116266087 isoform X2 n=1 Tax=Nymphaea colorata TaxID=210225 RepID=UPI00129E8217|nr:uncharacterized protein LOC116266087 isoform X2 [Nymphaea colorata]